MAFNMHEMLSSKNKIDILPQNLPTILSVKISFCKNRKKKVKTDCI